MTVEITSDREGSFESEFIKKHLSFNPNLEKRLTLMYTRGKSTCAIAEQLREFYDTEVSPALISKITNKRVLKRVIAWQQRPLDDVYAVVFTDAIHTKIRQAAKVNSKAGYSCMEINIDGNVDVLRI